MILRPPSQGSNIALLLKLVPKRIWVVKSVKIKWTGLLDRKEKRRNAYKI